MTIEKTVCTKCISLSGACSRRSKALPVYIQKTQQNDMIEAGNFVLQTPGEKAYMKQAAVPCFRGGGAWSHRASRLGWRALPYRRCYFVYIFSALLFTFTAQLA